MFKKIVEQIIICILLLTTFALEIHGQGLTDDKVDLIADSSTVLKLTFDKTFKDSLPIDESPNHIDINVNGRIRYAYGPDGEDDRAFLFKPEDTTTIVANSSKLKIYPPLQQSVLHSP